MPTLLTTIVPAAVTLIIGIVLGFLIQGIISENSNPQDGPKDSSPTPEGYREVLGVFQNPETRRFAVRLDGQAVPASRLSGQKQLRLAKLLEPLNRLIGREPAENTAQAEAAIDPIQALRAHGAVQSEIPETEDQPVANIPTTDLSAGSFAASLPEQPGLRESMTQSRFNPRRKSARATLEPANVSIVAQIDHILQAKIADSPLADQTIKLIELPEQGMVIQIGAERHEGVDKIPDPAIRALVKSAVAQWNLQNRAGS